jgi:proteasome beta subunit
MSMPFRMGDDPGANFNELLRRVGLAPIDPASSVALTVPHATTCVAVRTSEGVVMGGDRRATSGNLISHREMEKVVEADQFSGVAIAGAAGPAMEMVKLFQLQIEHYEKVEGVSLSLEGKANQLSMFVRNNLPAAMQGLMVVPIFAGFDVHAATGRLWDYDATGGRYEERDFVATGSGMLHASAVLRMSWKRDMTSNDAVELVAKALWAAAQADSATGGPDVARGIYPTVATITSSGFLRVDDAVLATLYTQISGELERP